MAHLTSMVRILNQPKVLTDYSSCKILNLLADSHADEWSSIMRKEMESLFYDMYHRAPMYKGPINPLALRTELAYRLLYEVMKGIIPLNAILHGTWDRPWKRDVGHHKRILNISKRLRRHGITFPAFARSPIR